MFKFQWFPLTLTLKFLLNACIGTLPAAANLQRWKKSTSDQCKVCKARETTCHILNNCPVSLQNGKYLWCHNNVVNYIIKLVDTNKYTVYSDLPGYTVGAGSIPPELCITVEKPDMTGYDCAGTAVDTFPLEIT